MRGWDLVGTALSGAFMGAAMGGLLAFGGGVSVGALAGISIGKGLLLSAGIGIAAGWGSYSIDTIISPNKKWNIYDFGIAGISGLFKGIVTYSIGLLAGRIGAFDQIILNPLLKGSKFVFKYIIYAFAKVAIGRNVFLTPLAEFSLKTISATIPAIIVRKIIDKIFTL